MRKTGVKLSQAPPLALPPALLRLAVVLADIARGGTPGTAKKVGHGQE